MHQRLRPLANAVGAALFLAILGAATLAAAANGNTLRRTSAEPAAWQGPALTAQLVPPAARDSAAPDPTTPNAHTSRSNPAPAEMITPSTTLPGPAPFDSPLLDGKLPSEELLPPVVAEGSSEEVGHHAVQPYGGGHPTDWSWGCGGNPYRTGPGICDNYKVGPRWHVTVDGMVMHRESTDLVALAGAMPGSFPANVPSGIPTGIEPAFEQFDYGPGGRIAFTSQVARSSCFDVQAVYEGVHDWDASVVYPKQALADISGAIVLPPSPNTFPAAPFPEGFEQRSLHYRSTLNSGELNFLPGSNPEWRPFFGVRFLRFDDQIIDQLNQERQIPLAGPLTGSSGGVVPVNVNDPIGPTSETDRFNLFHLQNNLMGFQMGLLKDTWRLNDRFSIEGFLNAGVYYNKVKYSNAMGVFTTQTFADNTRSTGIDDSRVDTSNIVNNDARELSEISYMSEASLTGVCRLNKCWALRGGYQVLWMNHIHTADAAYLGVGEQDRDLLFHGWHAGVECRR